MNPKLETLFSRRSIRAYEQEPVPDELLKDLLEAAFPCVWVAGEISNWRVSLTNRK